MLEDHGASHLIADRYLTSPAALRSRPMGPVDALDSRSGRAAQVRVLFVTGGWDGDDLSAAVSRWCGIGEGEVCGVLDFGRSGERWYLVLPPSLGVPLDRWRAMRRPTPGGAARLTLGYGRLVERVVASGFDADQCRVADFAVGPGAVPFLERPLLDRPDAPAPVAGSGQRVLAALLSAVCVEEACPADLGGWREQAAADGFATLAACLDELELVGSRAQADEVANDRAPLGLDGLFDDDPAPAGPVMPRRRPPRAAAVAAALAALLIAAVAAGHLIRHSRPPALVAAPQVQRPAPPAPPARPHRVAARPASRPAATRPAASRPAASRPPAPTTASAAPSAAESTAAPSAPIPARRAGGGGPAAGLPVPGGAAELPLP